ncbi:MAG: hypothetical protein K2M89_04200 [Clostridiales bacterium]|nr:hypothetical protein [Clostridiales bacterium]
MAEIINISNVTDLSGNPPIITPSNPVTTVINDPPTTPCDCYCCCECCSYCNCCRNCCSRCNCCRCRRCCCR